MDATCTNCPYWDAEPEDRRDPNMGGRECRVRSPAAYTVAADRDVERTTRWPITEPVETCGEHPLRQRDRLAAMAMQALIPMAPDHAMDAREVASDAYRYADALIASHPAPSPSVSRDAETDRRCAIASGSGEDRCQNDAWICHPHVSEIRARAAMYERAFDKAKGQLDHAHRAIRDLLACLTKPAEVANAAEVAAEAERFLNESERACPPRGNDA